MLKKTITYQDYNETERTENFYFNLSKAELMEMEVGTAGGFAEMLQRIVDTQDGPALIAQFKSLILKAYGKKSPDGKRFEKSEALSKEFSETKAYDILFMELMMDANAAAEFVNKIIPADIDRSQIDMSMLKDN